VRQSIRRASIIAVLLLILLTGVQAVRALCDEDEDSAYLPTYKEPVTVSTVSRQSLTPLYSFEIPEERGAVSAASEYLALAWRGTVKVYSLRKGNEILSAADRAPVKADGSSCRNVRCSLSPLGAYCAVSYSSSREVAVYDLKTGGCAARLPVTGACAITWSDMGDRLLTVSDDMMLQIWKAPGWNELSRYDLVAEKRAEHGRDFDLNMIHMMPDGNTVYYNVQWGRGSGWLFGLDCKTGQVHQLDSYGYSEPGVLSACFSAGSQYLCRTQFYPPGEGSIDIGTVVRYDPSELKPIPLFHAFGMYASSSMDSMGTYLAYSYSAYERRYRVYEKVLELLQLRDNRAYRIPLGEYEYIGSLHFSWYRSLLIVDWGDMAKAKRSVQVYDPRRIEGRKAD